MKDKNKGNSDQIGGRKELGVEEGETIIRIYYVRKNSVSNKRKKCYNEFFSCHGTGIHRKWKYRKSYQRRQ